MIETVGHLRRAAMAPPVCVGVHGVFAPGAAEGLREAGAALVVTTNTIPHATNAIDLAPVIAEACSDPAFGFARADPTRTESNA